MPPEELEIGEEAGVVPRQTQHIVGRIQHGGYPANGGYGIGNGQWEYATGHAAFTNWWRRHQRVISRCAVSAVMGTTQRRQQCGSAGTAIISNGGAYARARHEIATRRREMKRRPNVAHGLKCYSHQKANTWLLPQSVRLVGRRTTSVYCVNCSRNVVVVVHGHVTEQWPLERMSVVAAPE